MAEKRSTGSGLRALACFRLAAMLALLWPLAACDTLKSLDFRDALFPHSGQPVPGSTQPYPNLASVPDAAPPSTDKDTRQKIAEHLAAETKGNGASSLDDGGSKVAVPQPPAPLPKDFVTASQPVELADSAGTGSAAATPPGATKRPAGTGAKAQPALVAPGAHREVAIVLFDEDSAEIDPEEADKLKPVVDLALRTNGRLRLVGYASLDPHAPDQAAAKLAAFDLSLDRANAVAQLLIRLGAPAATLLLGAHAPISRGTHASGYAADPRVEIYLDP
jgi:outer membrane protein OmpA-like peptidoglycan-associated protein